jgi:hypothetical protein
MRTKRSKEEILRQLRSEPAAPTTYAEIPGRRKGTQEPEVRDAPLATFAAEEEQPRGKVVWFKDDKPDWCPVFFQSAYQLVMWCEDEGIELELRDGSVVVGPEGAEGTPRLYKEIRHHEEDLMAILEGREVIHELRKLIESEKEWAHTYQMHCESGAVALEKQAWQFREELEERLHRRLPPYSVEDALFDLAGELCPESPAADEDVFRDFASGIWERALAHYGRAWEKHGRPAAHRTGEQDAEACWGDRAAYRAEVRRWLTGELVSLQRLSESEPRPAA